MSYFQSLEGFRSAADQIRQHQTDMEQEFNDKKAQTIQEKFDHIEGVMNQAGGALTGFSAGFHLTRKIYKKVKGAAKAGADAAEGGAAGTNAGGTAGTNAGAAGTNAGDAAGGTAGDAAGTAGGAAGTAGDSAGAGGGADIVRAPRPGDADAAEMGEGDAGDLLSNPVTLARNVTNEARAGMRSALTDTTDVVEKGLTEASGVLDLLGPVGELLGAGVALGSLFRDVFEHKKLEREKEQAKGGSGVHPLIAQASGVSVASAQQAAKQTNVIGTLL